MAVGPEIGCSRTRRPHPDAVEAELREGVHLKSHLQQVLDAKWITTRQLASDQEIGSFAEFAARLVVGTRNVGEAAVLAYAKVHGATAVIDDGAGRQPAISRSPFARLWRCCATRSVAACSPSGWSVTWPIIWSRPSTACPSDPGDLRVGRTSTASSRPRSSAVLSGAPTPGSDRCAGRIVSGNQDRLQSTRSRVAALVPKEWSYRAKSRRNWPRSRAWPLAWTPL